MHSKSKNKKEEQKKLKKELFFFNAGQMYTSNLTTQQEQMKLLGIASWGGLGLGFRIEGTIPIITSSLIFFLSLVCIYCKLENDRIIAKSGMDGSLQEFRGEDDEISQKKVNKAQRRAKIFEYLAAFFVVVGIIFHVTYHVDPNFEFFTMSDKKNVVNKSDKRIIVNDTGDKYLKSEDLEKRSADRPMSFKEVVETDNQQKPNSNKRGD